MKFWKEKILSILTLVTLLVISSYGSIFLVETVKAGEGPGEVVPQEPLTLTAGGSIIGGGFRWGPKAGLCPLPNITCTYADDYDIIGWKGTAEGYHNFPHFILAGSIGRLAIFWYNIGLEGVFSAEVNFEVHIEWTFEEDPPVKGWYPAGKVICEVTIEGEGGGEFGNETCFLKGTKILMGNLSVKNIEEIQVNDTVKTMDMVTGEIGNDTVFELQEHSDEEMANGCLEITIENKFRITVTPDHPISVMEDDFEELLKSSDPNITTDGTEFAFIRAGDLEVGDRAYCGNVTNIVEYPSAKAESYSLLLKNNLTYIVACTPLYEQQYEPPSGQFASELDDWKALTFEMHQMSAPIYYPVMAPAVKGNPESYVYFEGLGEYFEEGVGACALPMLQLPEE